jgi:hypothetical protein
MARKINPNFTEIDVGLLERKLKLELKKVNFNGKARVRVYDIRCPSVVRVSLRAVGRPKSIEVTACADEMEGLLPWVCSVAIGKAVVPPYPLLAWRANEYFWTTEAWIRVEEAGGQPIPRLTSLAHVYGAP